MGRDGGGGEERVDGEGQGGEGEIRQGVRRVAAEWRRAGHQRGTYFVNFFGQKDIEM